MASSLASSLRIAYMLLVAIGAGFNVCWQDKARVLLSILFMSILIALVGLSLLDDVLSLRL